MKRTDQILKEALEELAKYDNELAIKLWQQAATYEQEFLNNTHITF